MDICAGVKLKSDDKANAQDSELLTHARALLDIVSECEKQLEIVKSVLLERRGYIDAVIWQINEQGERLPALVVAQ